MKLSSLTALTLSLACAMLIPLTARAQSYPNRPIKLIVPYVAGSPVDVVSRIIAQHASARLGAPIIIDNRAGAGTTIGTKAVAAATPDGYTLLTGGSALAFMNYYYPKLDFDPKKELTQVATVAGYSHLLVVSPKHPAKTLADFVTYAKDHPGAIKFGFGLATTPQVLGEYLKTLAGLDILSVPYRGGENARQDLLGGQIDMNFVPSFNVISLIQDNQLKPLVVTGNQRDALLPDVPTMAESGFPKIGFNPDTFVSIAAPAGTPEPIVRKLNEVINATLQSEETRETLKRLGMVPMIKSTQQANDFIAQQYEAWPSVLKAANITPQE